MGQNFSPLLADLFLYYYENEFLDKLIKKGKRKLARMFNLSYCHIDDLIFFDDKIFEEFISDFCQCTVPTIHSQPVLALSFFTAWISPIFSQNLDCCIFTFISVCLLLVYFVSAAGCHCFDLCCLDFSNVTNLRTDVFGICEIKEILFLRTKYHH